jgi:hypothetical protein
LAIRMFGANKGHELCEQQKKKLGKDDAADSMVAKGPAKPSGQ